METTDKQLKALESLDNPKLIDVVKNYKLYGYTEIVRDTAVKTLESRGVDMKLLEMRGDLHNPDLEAARDLYGAFRRNSRRAFISYVASIFLPLFLLIFNLDYPALLVVVSVLKLVTFTSYMVFFIRSLLNQSNFYKAIGLDNQYDSYFYVVGFLFYIIMYFVYKKQMREDMKYMISD